MSKPLRYFYVCEAQFKKRCDRPVTTELQGGYLLCALCRDAIIMMGRQRHTVQLALTVLPQRNYGRAAQDRQIENWVRQMKQNTRVRSHTHAD